MSAMPHPAFTGRAWAELGGLAFLWGGSFLAMAVAAREMGPLTVVLHRVGWAALLLWLVVAVQGAPVPRSWRVWGAFLVMGALNNVIPFGLITWGQLHIETGLASVLNAMTAPFGVVVAALCLRDERLTVRRGAGVLLGVAGVVVIKGLDRLAAVDPRALGQLAVLGAALSYAFASVWGRRMLGGIRPTVAAAGMLTGSTLLAAPLAWGIEGAPSLALSREGWAAIAYMAGFATAGAYLLYYRVLAIAGAGNLMLVTLIVPPLAILLGWIVLGEALAPRVFAGFALVAAGLAVIDGRILALMRGVRSTRPGV